MTRESIVLMLGIILFLMPHLGVPEQWKFYFYTAAGLVLIFVGYSLRRSAYLRSIETEDGGHDGDSFAEHKGSRESSVTEEM
tara:strand:- start:2850 stop:3095 length:246 start_codon:yes stop_codon:yes gene_type:complete